MRSCKGEDMKTKVHTTVLFILFAILCVCVIAAGIMAVRYTQGTAAEGDWVLVLILSGIAILDVVLIRNLY